MTNVCETVKKTAVSLYEFLDRKQPRNQVGSPARPEKHENN